MIAIAREKVEKILTTLKGHGLTSEIEGKLNKYYKIIASRSMEDYQKAEGIDNNSSSALS